MAARLAKLVERPDLLQQRRLNLCGPAAFLRAWALRDLAAFARFGAALYDDAAGRRSARSRCAGAGVADRRGLRGAGGPLRRLPGGRGLAGRWARCGTARTR
ncbi:MAG: hypothetical protein U0470_13315 [Anaerolineae bacterium]